MAVNPEYPWLELYLQEPGAPEPFKAEWRRIRRDFDDLRVQLAAAIGEEEKAEAFKAGFVKGALCGTGPS